MEGIGMTTATNMAAPGAATIEEEASVLDAIEAPHFSPPTPITQEIAVVLDDPQGRLSVRVGERHLAAQRAVSCLVAPEKGDRVLVALTPDGPFVLAVLLTACMPDERASPATTGNPFFSPSELPLGMPAFDRIRPEHVSPAIDVLLVDANAALDKAVGADVPADYDAMSAVLDTATERLTVDEGRERVADERRFRHIEATCRSVAEPDVPVAAIVSDLELHGIRAPLELERLHVRQIEPKRIARVPRRRSSRAD